MEVVACNELEDHARDLGKGLLSGFYTTVDDDNQAIKIGVLGVVSYLKIQFQ